MAEWIVRANPDKYDLRKRLAEDPTWIIDWGVPPNRRGQVRRSHRVLLATSGEQGAVYAYGVILSDVVIADDAKHELQFELDPGYFQKSKERVFIEITDRLRTPVPLADVRQVPGLAGMEVFTGYQATSFFPITDTEAPLLDDFLAQRNPTP
jgi:hypothetical protein